MKKGICAGVIALGAIGWGTSVFADPPKVSQVAPAAKLLLPKTGGAINAPAIERIASLPAALPSGEKTTLVSSIAASKPAAFPSPPRTPFVASPADLKVGTTETRLMFPRWVYPSFAEFGSPGGFVISGMADGAWFADCSVSTSGALFVATGSKSSSNATVSSSSSSITPSSGHLTFGAYFNAGSGGENTITVTKQDGFVWFRCELTPVP